MSYDDMSSEVLNDIIENQETIPPEFNQFFLENFWDLLA